MSNAPRDRRTGRSTSAERVAVLVGLVTALAAFSSTASGQPTVQDFDVDNVGTDYCTLNLVAPGRPPELQSGGPVPIGRFMRLGFLTPVPNANSIAFLRTRRYPT